MPTTTAPEPALPSDIAAKVDQHNRQLHDQLQITPQEQPQWDKFTAVTTSNAADIGQAFDERSAKLDTMNASENMQSFAHVAQVHAANMQKAAEAFQALLRHLFSRTKAAGRHGVPQQAGREERYRSQARGVSCTSPVSQSQGKVQPAGAEGRDSPG